MINYHGQGVGKCCCPAQFLVQRFAYKSLFISRHVRTESQRSTIHKSCFRTYSVMTRQRMVCIDTHYAVSGKSQVYSDKECSNNITLHTLHRSVLRYGYRGSRGLRLDRQAAEGSDCYDRVSREAIIYRLVLLLALNNRDYVPSLSQSFKHSNISTNYW